MRQSHLQASLSPLTVSKKYLPDQIQAAAVALHGHLKGCGGWNIQLAVCRRLMLLIFVNTNGKRLSCSNEIWRGDPRKLLSGDKLITNCGVTLTSGSHLEDRILESLLWLFCTIEVTQTTVSILEIIGRRILNAWGTLFLQKVKLTKVNFFKKQCDVSLNFHL